MPMLMTAAGTVKAARVLILGAGVAGLQAIATAKRLGAVIEAFDVRPAVKEQCESLGAKFVEVTLSEDERKAQESAGGYAREMSDDYKQRQAALIAERAKASDIVITTALIPGRPAPMLMNTFEAISRQTVTSGLENIQRLSRVRGGLSKVRGGNLEGAKLILAGARLTLTGARGDSRRCEVDPCWCEGGMLAGARLKLGARRMLADARVEACGCEEEVLGGSLLVLRVYHSQRLPQRCACRNRPVCEPLVAAMVSGVPHATTRPPACPPSGPRSIT